MITDEALMGLLRGGDREVLGVLFVRHAAEIRQMLARICRSMDTARDLTSDTFIKLFEVRHQYEDGRPFLPWLRTIARNLALDRLRHRRRRPTVSYGVATDPSPFVRFELVDGASPEAIVTDREERERLHRCVTQLPEIFRQTIVKRVFEGLPFKEVAAATGTREDTARSRMFAALTRLQKEMAQ